jgi:hypothetical protein
VLVVLLVCDDFATSNQTTIWLIWRQYFFPVIFLVIFTILDLLAAQDALLSMMLSACLCKKKISTPLARYSNQWACLGVYHVEA